MRKRLLLTCTLLFVIVVGSLWFLSRPIKHRINDEGYHGIQMGMTEQEVIQVLGVKPGDHGPGVGEIIETGCFTMASASIRSDPKGKKWLAGDFAITVCFDEGGRVNGKATDSVYRPYDTPIEMVCQRVGVMKKKPYPPGSFNAIFNGK